MKHAPQLSSPSAELALSDLIQALEADVLFGKLKPRERLLEDRIIAQYGTKRHVVRQALGELERLGIVVRVPNRGAAVRDFSAREVEEICEIREVLQAGAARLIPFPAAPELISTLTALQEQHDEAVRQRDPRAIDRVNEQFHRVFFEACGNSRLADLIAHYAYLSRAMRLYPLIDAALLETLRSEHWAMIRALEEKDRGSLVRLVVDHIQHSKSLYLQVRAAAGEDR